MTKVVAIDLGAESGRVMEICLLEGKLSIDERHRFANSPVRAGGTLYRLHCKNDVLSSRAPGIVAPNSAT